MRLLVLLGLMLTARLASAADTKAPVVEHTPPAKATKGQRVTLSVRITDDSEVFLPALHVRTGGAGAFVNKELRKQGDTFTVQLEVTEDLEYWIEAYDEHGNGPTTSGTATRPHRLRAEAPAPRAAAPRKEPAAQPRAQADTTPPTLVHTPLEEAVAGEETTISAVVTDPSGVFAPTLYTRAVGAPNYDAQELKPDGDRYAATIPVTEPFDYWLEAYDNEGNGPTRSGAPEAPHRVTLRTPEALSNAVLDPTPPPEEPSIFARVPTRWWVGGAAGVVGAAVAGVVVYSLASQDDSYGRVLVLSQSRR